MSAYKRFDERLFLDNDTPARSAVMRHIDAAGLYITDNDDRYGPDLIVYKGLKKSYYIECEIKNVWSGADFPYDSVQLPSRKEKFLKAGLPIEFWILNKELTHAVVLPDFIIDSSFLVEVPNRLVSSGEYFYQIPIDKCIIKKL
jgi:hypothetical protein